MVNSLNNSKVMSNKVSVPIKKRPIKSSAIYLLSIIILGVVVSFALYEFLYKSYTAFLTIPIIIIGGIFLNGKSIINIIDYIFNLYEITVAVCTSVEYKTTKENDISDKYSLVYFTDFKNNKVIKIKFNYKVKFNEGNVYKITLGKLSKTYVSTRI